MLLTSQACYNAMNIVRKLGIKKNIAEKLENIGVTPNNYCEEVIPTKICRKFFREVTVQANGVKKKANDSFNN